MRTQKDTLINYDNEINELKELICNTENSKELQKQLYCICNKQRALLRYYKNKDNIQSMRKQYYENNKDKLRTYYKSKYVKKPSKKILDETEKKKYYVCIPKELQKKRGPKPTNLLE